MPWTPEEALRRIREAERTGAVDLDLSGGLHGAEVKILKTLTRLPPELERLSSLQSLDLFMCLQLSGDLSPLASLTSLKSLYCPWCYQLSGDLSPLAGLTSLQSLNLAGCRSLNGDLSPLAGLTSLQTLNLAGGRGWSIPLFLSFCAYCANDRTSRILSLHCLAARSFNEIRWFTFAGNILNLAIADTLRQHGYTDVRVSDFWICIKDTTDYQPLFEKIDGFNAEAVRAAFRVPEEYLKQLTFSECLPQPYAAKIVKDRLLEPARLETLLRKRCKFVVMPNSSSPGTDQE